MLAAGGHRVVRQRQHGGESDDDREESHAVRSRRGRIRYAVREC
jgi:hypothetical protein